MTFSYNSYRDIFLFLPVIIILSSVVVVFIASYDYWAKFASKKDSLYATLRYLFCLVVLFACIVSQSKYLLNGGIQLLWESKESALIHTGLIETIHEPSERFPGFKLSHCYGADIVIDGVQYFAITADNYREGEIVTIHYLPNSHFILSIVHLNYYQNKY